MPAAYFTGLLYFAAVFTFAFAMGIARVLVVAPRLGPTAAVLLEVPILVVASWIVARRLLRNRSLTLPQRATMGATAFTLTMASEAALSVIMRGQSVTEWAGAVATPLGLAGLVGQVVFAAMPIFVGHGRTDTSPAV
jgi:hypothetical protein